MPRLLPRLHDALVAAAARPLNFVVPPALRRRRRVKSLYTPPPPASSLLYHPDHTRSLLLEPGNALTERRRHARHKTFPPRVHVTARQRRRMDREAEGREPGDVPRAMTEEERRWHSSPYLRMLASPLRECLLTERDLPTDFLVRLSGQSLPGPRTAAREHTFLMPDGLEHPKFAARRGGHGAWLPCWRAAAEHAIESGTYKRTANGAAAPPHLLAHIAHLLRLRVLQELALLTGALRLAPRARGDDGAPLLRRLTRAEFARARATAAVGGVTDLNAGAVALLVVPPLNRDPQTKKRPRPVMDALPPDDSEDISSASASLFAPRRPPPPLSELLLTGTGGGTAAGSESDPLEKVMQHPPPRVPLYNGVALFPARAQRAALHAGLCGLLAVENRVRARAGLVRRGADDTDSERGARARGEAKASHAFLLRSDAETLRRADSVPLAIALWRLRMWEGTPWMQNKGIWDQM